MINIILASPAGLAPLGQSPPGDVNRMLQLWRTNTRYLFEPLKAGDVPATYASTDKLQDAVGFNPSTSIEEGLQKFADWYVEYYGVK